MFELHPVSRLAVLLTTAMLLAGCAKQPPDVVPTDASPCSKGALKNNPQGPIVCVDDSGPTLVVTPYHVLVHESLKNDKAKPVKIDWYTTSGTGDLQLEVKDGCVVKHQCNGNGHCWTKTIPGVVGYGEVNQCKYDVWIVGGRQPRLDPTIIITGCC